MDKFDILEAMSGIRDEYIEDAAAFPNQAVQSEEQNVPLENKRGKDPKRPKILRLQRWAATAAALLCVCVIAFTIRSSQSERAADSDLKDAGKELLPGADPLPLMTAVSLWLPRLPDQRLRIHWSAVIPARQRLRCMWISRKERMFPLLQLWLMPVSAVRSGR